MINISEAASTLLTDINKAIKLLQQESNPKDINAIGRAITQKALALEKELESTPGEASSLSRGIVIDLTDALTHGNIDSATRAASKAAELARILSPSRLDSHVSSLITPLHSFIDSESHSVNTLLNDFIGETTQEGIVKNLKQHATQIQESGKVFAIAAATIALGLLEDAIKFPEKFQEITKLTTQALRVADDLIATENSLENCYKAAEKAKSKRKLKTQNKLKEITAAANKSFNDAIISVQKLEKSLVTSLQSKSRDSSQKSPSILEIGDDFLSSDATKTIDISEIEIANIQEIEPSDEEKAYEKFLYRAFNQTVDLKTTLRNVQLVTESSLNDAAKVTQEVTPQDADPDDSSITGMMKDYLLDPEKP